jgi:GH24 family phage-related lysozyme (muramidase)
MQESLTDFRGSTRWIHAREGSGLEAYGRSAYWPGGESGVTLDPGFDLGYQTEGLLRSYYDQVLTEQELAACASVIGLRRQAAKAALHSETNEGKTLRGIKIPTDEQQALFALVAASYWQKIRERFSAFRDECTPGVVQTALLSLAYNRGAGNDDLAPLAGPLASASWDEVGWQISQMQQNHSLNAIRLRRRREGALIVQPLLTRRTDTPRGSLRNAALLNAQERLRWVGTYDGPVDGIFGQGTERAVIDFQKRADLEYVDGMIGPETWSALLSNGKAR